MLFELSSEEAIRGLGSDEHAIDARATRIGAGAGITSVCHWPLAEAVFSCRAVTARDQARRIMM